LAGFPIFQRSGRKQRRAWLGDEVGNFEVFVQEFFELVVHGKLFLFTAFLFKAEQKPFP
jgi:hypothetical protein